MGFGSSGIRPNGFLSWWQIQISSASSGIDPNAWWVWDHGVLDQVGLDEMGLDEVAIPHVEVAYIHYTSFFKFHA